MRFSLLVKLFFTIVLLQGFTAQAKECLLEEALKDPKLYNNQQFWDDYAQMADAEDPTAIKALLEKYNTETNAPTPDVAKQANTNSGVAAAPAGSRSLKLNISSKAEKEIAKLQRGLSGKVDEFVSIVSKPNGIKEIRSNPGRWNLEKLTNSNLHTVRLSKGVRIMFEVKDDELRILRVNREQIHEDPFQ